MSRYEDPEGTGESPAGGKRRVRSLRRRSGRADDTGNWNASGRSRRGRTRSEDSWEPSGRTGTKHAGGSGQPPSRTRRVLGRHPVVSVLAILATLTITFVSLSAYAAYRNVYDSIHHVTVTSRQLGKRPPKLNGSQNILIIGSDSRSGTRGKYGRGIQGSRSDTSMLLHIPPAHTGATVISFPRDTMVPIYSCQGDGQGHPGQQAQPGSLEQLNWTFSYGGAACLWRTLEQVTRIHIDHFVEVDFSGFKSIVNDVGGVPVCLPYAIRDPASKLNLPVGKSVVHGDQALAFVRERHIGLGSDLQRINRQQIFLASLAQRIKQSSSLTNPTKLYGLVHDIASSLTTDTGLTLTNMYAIANSLKGLSTSALQFIMAPVLPYPANPASQVEFSQPSADQLFRAIARDSHILKAARRAAHAKAQPVPTVKPAKVQLQVLNGTNISGLAATTASQLTARGFKVAGTGNATGTASSTVIEYASAAQMPQVSTLQEEIPGAQVKQVSSLKGSTLSLVLGSGFKGVESQKSKKKKARSTSAAALSKNYGGVNGAANICKQSAAFTGPDNPSMFGNG
jgi:LCP family protein required for cell wall assembly